MLNHFIRKNKTFQRASFYAIHDHLLLAYTKTCGCGWRPGVNLKLLIPLDTPALSFKGGFCEYAISTKLPCVRQFAIFLMPNVLLIFNKAIFFFISYREQRRLWTGCWTKSYISCQRGYPGTTWTRETKLDQTQQNCYQSGQLRGSAIWSYGEHYLSIVARKPSKDTASLFSYRD